MKKNIKLCFFTIFIISISKLSFSEPFVVLEYRGNSDRGNLSSDNLFLKDLNYSFLQIHSFLLCYLYASSLALLMIARPLF